MEWFFYALIALAIYGYIKIKTGRKAEKPAKSQSPQRSSSGKGNREIPEWLTERWTAANAAEASKDFTQFGAWYFDEPSTHQIERLRNDGWMLKAQPSKGQASDLIGLGEDADPEQLETLAFFKIKRRTMSQTEAREALRQIFANPDNVALWEARPAASGQKLFFQFFDVKMPKGLSQVDADAAIAEVIVRRPEIADQWEALADAWNELQGPETREDYGLKKFTSAQFAAAAKAVLADEEEDNDLDADTISEKLLDLYPQLER